MGVVVFHSYANNESVVMGVVETLGIFLRKPNYVVVHPCYLWDEPRQLDILNHPKVGFS